jgi:hypothetical protein
MSRGPGKMQSLILSNLNGEKLFQLNVLRWQLWTEEFGNPNSDMSKSFYVSFNRALELLDDRLIRKRRRLRDLKELRNYYPFKTQKAQIRDLRRKLLPFFEEFVNETGAKYTEAQNENFLFRQLLPEDQQFSVEAWRRLESRIYTLIGSAEAKRSRILIQLVTRAWELFRTEKHVSVKNSFRYLAESAFESSVSDPFEQSIKDEVFDILNRCFPGSTLPRARLKSQVYRAFSFSKKAQPHLKQDFREFLTEKHHNFLETLPGHQPAERKAVEKRTFYIPREERLSPMLDNIVTRDVFTAFEFVRLR